MELAYWALIGTNVSTAHKALLLNMCADPSLFDKSSQISLNHLSSTWRARFRELMIDMLLSVEGNPIWVTLNKSEICMLMLEEG